MLDGLTDIQAFGLVAALCVMTAGAGRAAIHGLEESRPFLLLGGWMAAMVGAIAVIVAWPAVLSGVRPLWSGPLVASFVRAHDLPLTAVLAVGALAAALLEVLAPARRSAAVAARAEAVGAAGESLVALQLQRSGLPSVRGLILGGRGWSTEIDHVVLVGGSIVAIETKTLSGRIEGRPNDRKWVQRTGKRERWFLNPLVQNATHLEALRQAIGALDVPLRGLVVLAGSATIADELRGSVVPVAELGDVLGTDLAASSAAADAAWSIVLARSDRGGDRQAHAAYARRRSRF